MSPSKDGENRDFLYGRQVKIFTCLRNFSPQMTREKGGNAWESIRFEILETLHIWHIICFIRKTLQGRRGIAYEKNYYYCGDHRGLAEEKGQSQCSYDTV